MQAYAETLLLPLDRCGYAEVLRCLPRVGGGNRGDSLLLGVRGGVAAMTFHDVEIMHVTERAVLCLIKGEEYWVPKSQILNLDDIDFDFGYATVKINNWFARTKMHPSEDSYSLPPPPPSNHSAIDLQKSSRLFKRLVKEFHPDVNKQGEQTCKAITELWNQIQAELKAPKK